MIPPGDVRHGGNPMARVLASLVDPAWYRSRHPDIAAAGLDPVHHFVNHGLNEGRDPNPFFDSTWYLKQYPDVAQSGTKPLLHYLFAGMAEGHNPHPRFDAAYYIEKHPEAAANPLLYHLRVGRMRQYPTEYVLEISDYLPSGGAPLGVPKGVTADVVIRVERETPATRRCLQAALDHSAPPLGRIIIIDDRCPDAALTAWLRTLADGGRITLLRHARRLGVAACLNRGFEESGANDVVLLDRAAEVQAGWLSRLAAAAYASARIATAVPLSNAASVGGYSGDACHPLPFGLTGAEIDAACRTANAGRAVTVPATDAGCLYVTRAALRTVGVFAAEPSQQGGEALGFCRRATAAGWTHRLAGDVFVQHHRWARRSGAPSTRVTPDRDAGGCRGAPAAPERRDPATPMRFALTAALLRASTRPVILMIAGEQADEVRRHIDSLVTRYRDQAHVVLLENSQRGPRLSIPALPSHPGLTLPADAEAALERLLRAMNVSRLHIHGMTVAGLDVRKLALRLGLPFDVTVHDYYAICPQRDLLPWDAALYCGEPGPGRCNACIADPAGQPGDAGSGVRDILSWRLEHAWPFLAADRVICPSGDARRRLERFGLAEQAIIAPHEMAGPLPWSVSLPAYTGPALRVAILGALSNRKGGRVVASLAGLVPREQLSVHLIGHTDDTFPKAARKLITQTGAYTEADLPSLVRRIDPHVIWFPSPAPETYSYTLTEAIESGLPIVAPDLGSFPERLTGRPMTWLVDPHASTSDIRAVFEQVRRALIDPPAASEATRPVASTEFYERAYLAPKVTRRAPSGRRILLLPVRRDDGAIARSGYLRLLLPLDHAADGYQLVLGDAAAAVNDDADIIVVQPGALPDSDAADRLIAHARRTGARLVLDLEEAPFPGDPGMPGLLQEADAVWVASAELARQIAPLRADATVVETRLDERLWLPPATAARRWDEQIRILWLGDEAAPDDFALIEPALLRLREAYDDKIVIDLLHPDDTVTLPPGLRPLRPSRTASRSYPALVHWLRCQQPPWHIGLAPMRDREAHRPPVLPLEYAALGIPVLASDVPAWRGSIADGPAGQLVANTPAAWLAAIDWMIRDEDWRQTLAGQARAAFEKVGTLQVIKAIRLAALRGLMAGSAAPPGVSRRRSRTKAAC